MNKVSVRKILGKAAVHILNLFLILLLIVSIINISPDLGVQTVDNKGNFIQSMDFEVYKNEILKSVKGLSSGEYFKTMIYRKGISVRDAIKSSLGRSMVVLFISLTLATGIGILKGIFDSRRNKKYDDFKLLQTLIPLSVPDVLVISLVQMLGFYLYKNKVTLFGIGPIMHIGYEHWTNYLYPILALSLIPVAYIARITSTSIEAVYDKDYILTARGKGCSERRIIFNHSMRNVITDLIASFPAIVSILFSALFIVERLFYFPGVTFEIMDFYARPAADGSTTIALISFAVVLGILYFMLYTVLDVLRQILLPKLKN